MPQDMIHHGAYPMRALGGGRVRRLGMVVKTNLWSRMFVRIRSRQVHDKKHCYEGGIDLTLRFWQTNGKGYEDLVKLPVLLLGIPPGRHYRRHGVILVAEEDITQGGTS